MARGTARKPYMTADGKDFETREKAIKHIFKIQTGRSDWTDYIYLGGSPHWRVYENGVIKKVRAGEARPHSTARNLPVPSSASNDPAPAVPEMSPWRTHVFNSHAAAVGFLNRIKKRHVAVIEQHGISQWRVAYLPEGKGMPLNA